MTRLFQSGKCHGQGEETAPDGSVYDGEWANDAWHGFGHWQGAPGAGSYKGSWRAGQRHGEGSQEQEDGSVFEGHWLRGQINGRGTLRLPNGQVRVMMTPYSLHTAF
jgi:hypothetical protein